MFRVDKKLFIKIIIVIFAAVIFNVAYFTYIHKSLTELVDAYISNELYTGSVAVSISIDKKMSEVKFLSKLDIMSDETIEIEQKLKFLTDYRRRSGGLRIYLSDLNGECISNYGETIYINDYDFFQKASTGRITISPPIYNYQESKWTIAVASPIRNSAGQMENIVVAFYDADEFNEIINGIDLGKSTVTLITDLKGVVISNNSDIIEDNIADSGTIYEKNKALSGIKEIQEKAILEGAGSGEFMFDGVLMKAYYRPVLNNDWILISAAAKDVIYKQVDYITYVVEGVTVLILIAGFMCLIYSIKVNSSLKIEKNKNKVVLKASNLVLIRINRKGEITYYNDNFLKYTGYNETELKNKTVYNIIPDGYYFELDMYLDKIFSGNEISEFDMPIIGDGGKWIYVLWNTNIVKKGRFNDIELIGINISNIKEYERKIQRLAYFDQLTGLHNLTYLEEYFNSVASMNKSKKMAVMYIDIDNFKEIKEMFGHSTGDKFIVDICNKITNINNDKVKVCRNGGDEVVIFYENIKDRDEIDNYVKLVMDAVKCNYHINNITSAISPSIGISIYPDDGSDYSELFNNAAAAMRSAKISGKDRVVYFSNAMKSNMYEQSMIENELEEGIKNNEFTLFYQSQYNVDTGELCGFEALVRWLSSKNGFMVPKKFLIQAEKNQLIIPLGYIIIEKACDFLKKLQQLGKDNLYVSINISLIQLLCNDFEDKVLDIIKKKEVKAENIKFEITEKIIIDNIDDVERKIRFLTENGIGFSVDNFGKGYTSLAHLSSLPLETLKFDKTFVESIMEDDDKKEILSCIINLAKNINLKVVAEGIELAEQLNWMKEKGNVTVQGFYVGSPVPENEALDIIEKNIYNFKPL